MVDSKPNVHAGHRQRMREEILKHKDFDALQPHRILEVLLFYGIPRKDTNPIAHELLNKFGSLSGVLDAEFSDLVSVKGMTENAATLIKTVLPLARRYENDKFKAGYKFANVDEIGKYLLRRYLAFKNETFGVICLDSAGRLLGFDVLGEGATDVVAVNFRDIAMIVLKYNAPCVIVVHNHIGSAVPSDEDIEMTISLKRSLASLGTRLLDHMILSGDDYVSMRQSKKFSAIFK